MRGVILRMLREEMSLSLFKRISLKFAITTCATIMMVVGFGLLAPSEAGAQNKENLYTDQRLPPGFQICPDINLVRAYMMMVSGDRNQNQVKLMLRSSVGLTSEDVSMNTPLTEPAYWFAIEYYNYKYQSYGNNGIIEMNNGTNKFFQRAKNENLAMYNWAFGISKFFQTWVEKKNTYSQETENFLLKAIFIAADHSEYEVADYQKLDLSAREGKLKGLMADFERLGAEVKRKQEALSKQQTTDKTKSKTDAKDLDKKIFILEKRLQREKLTYEKEYELTQELKSLKSRQNPDALNQMADQSAQREADRKTSARSDEDTKLLIAQWASFILTLHYYKLDNKESGEMVNRILEKPLNVQTGRVVRGPPMYGI